MRKKTSFISCKRLCKKKSGKVEKVYAAMGGTGAIFSEDFLDLLTVPEEELKLLLQTPATAIGSSRYALWDDDYKKMPEIFKKYNIRYVLLNGGNGTMDTCGRIHKVCVVEAMGRNAGWITATSVLARKEKGDAPLLIYLPEGRDA